jgi:pSer/pThr/pTyr-binding forkhead associated (FHA) protein
MQRRKTVTAPLEMLDAYLIVGGRRHVAVDRPVNTIGRSLENDIVLEDPGVSRRHAQIRWRNGRFVLLDLGSRAGTLVNDRPISEHELTSGDIITLGGAQVIYGEEGAIAQPKATGQVMGDDITRELTRDE